MYNNRPIAAPAWFVTFFLAYFFASNPLAAQTPTRPNILVILIDDMGWSDFGCYGSEISTPHIDALAAGGVRFTQFYNTARCSPTRASLMTGLYPHQAGMGHLDNTVFENSKGTQGRLRNDCVTMGEVLGDAGYFTIMTGKWHMGQYHKENSTPPWKRGFMRSLNSAIGETYFPDQKQRREHGLHLNGKRYELDDPIFGENWYGPDLLTEWGLKFVDEAKTSQKPFFWYFAHSSLHFPLQVPQEDIDRYRGKYMAGWDALRRERHRRQIEMGLVDPAWQLAERPPDVPAWDSLNDEDKERFDHIMAIYAAMLDRVDRSIGTLVDGLAQRGMLEDTLILILADNGGNAESGPRGRLEGDQPGGPQSTVYLGQCWATLANTPFRRYKHFTHEGGIATPLVVHWPAGIPKQRGDKLEHQPGHLVDIMPTAVAVSGASYPSEFNGHAIQPMEGVSLIPAFAAQPLMRKEPIFWEHEGNRALRSGKWKLVMKLRGPWELYDTQADRTESRNLIEEEPELANELIAKWEAWAKRADVDPWPGPARNDWGEEAQQPKRSGGTP
ncbi:MAG TPA: arylsulfatase [Lacipirellulaceae bacterium]|nr:arylsulfatase [Lacipirellulaceae bacterium]